MSSENDPINRYLLSGESQSEGQLSNLSKQQEFSALKKQPGSTVWQATVNICKCGLGSTLLFMPNAFATAGWIEVILLLLITALMCNYSWGILTKVLEALNENEDGISYTLQLASGKILGKKFQILTEVVTIFFNMGSILGYEIFILKSMTAVVGDTIDSSYRSYVILGLIAIVYFPFSMLPKIEKLSWLSSFGVFSCCLAFSIIIVDSIYIMASYGVYEGDLISNYFSLSEISSYFGVIMFAYDINGVITDVHSSMQDKSKFPMIIKIYLLFMFTCAVLLGSLGYFALGMPLTDSSKIIFDQLNNLGNFVYVIDCTYSLALLGSFLLFAFPLFIRSDSVVNSKISQLVPQNKIVKGLCRIVFYAFIMIIAIIYPRIIEVLNLLGSIFSVTLGFIFPITLYQSHFKGSISTTTYVLNYSVLVLGIAGGISGVYSTISSF